MLRDIDLRLLEIFCYVYEKRSLTEAAKFLHTSQSTLSFHIKNLERQIGQKLFYRKGRSLVPTTIADKLYSYAKEITVFKNRLLDDIGRYSGRRGGVIRIGASSIPGNYLLPDLIGEFLETFNGDFNIELVIGGSMDIYNRVISGSVDFGIVGYLPDKRNLEFFKLCEDRIWIVGNPQLEDRTYTLSELKDLPLVIREEGSGTRRKVEECLRQYGISLKDMNILATLGSNEAIKKLLRYEKAYSFLSNFVIKDDNFLVKLRVSGFDPIIRSFYIIKDSSRPLPPSSQEFFEFFIFKSKTILDY